MKPTPCFKVTNSKMASAMSRDLPDQFVIQYKLNEPITATTKHPVFCFETLEQAQDFAGRFHGMLIFEAIGENRVHKTRIGSLNWISTYFSLLKRKKSTGWYARKPIRGTLFFTKVTLTKQVPTPSWGW